LFTYCLFIVLMIILGIETSCDETAAALVKDGKTVIASIVASSQKLHIKTKGVIPEVAAREQVKCIIPVLKETFNQIPNSKFQIPKDKPEDFIDAIAVTFGPGLIGSLLVGVETAKTLAYGWQKPIIPINHLIGHIYTNFVNTNYQLTNTATFTNYFPAIVLIVSGGHTELLLMTNHGKYQWLGGTRDDAAGECFDKCARILGLPYPGGPTIAAEAAKLKVKSEEFKVKLPRPMINQNNFDFSFSGLKTALFNIMLNLSQHPNGILKQVQNDIMTISSLAFEVQEAITDVLVGKTIRAAEKFKVKSIIIGGGVTANQRLREKFREKVKNFQLLMPEISLSTDNAVGIASAAFFNYKPVPWQKITADPSLEII